MREWNLTINDPLSLTIASDIRFVSTDYFNDQIWELETRRGDPVALALQTTFGLRAKSFRIFPRFIQDGRIVVDPTEFSKPIIIKQIFPNYISLEFSPFNDLDVSVEFWVPESHSISGRYAITNNGLINRQIKFEIIVQLTPTTGHRMAVREIDSTKLLSGETGGLFPVVFLTGGPKAGSGAYPSLSLTLDLHPNETRRYTWVHVAENDLESSFTQARNIIAKKWEAEVSRLEMMNTSHVDIYTGDPNWDSVFMLTQKIAVGLLVGPTNNLPHPSFVFSRQPDQGYSIRGDGSDYNHLWDGQTPLDSYYLACLTLPIIPEKIKGLLSNFLNTQDEVGNIDWKPGLGGQRSHILATPILSYLAWRIYETTEDISFLKDNFDGLLLFLRAWFTPEHDRDNDGVPEWDQVAQSAVDDHPIYSLWSDRSLGVDITSAEGPSLCSFLYNECYSLKKIAAELKRNDVIPELEVIMNRLKNAVETAWHEDEACYYDWDRDTQISTHGELLIQQTGPGMIIFQRQFENPIRLLIHIRTGQASKCDPQLFIHGTGASGYHRVERIGQEQFKWIPNLGRMTGKYVYTSIDRIEINNLDPLDEIVVYNVDYHFQDQRSLAPLWAGIPEKERAGLLVEKTITNSQKYWRPYGIPACVQPTENPDSIVCDYAYLPWVTLICEGLVKYNYRKQAAELVIHLMKAIINTVKNQNAFRQYYHVDTGEGKGERNTLAGLAPVGLFLDVLGVRIISANRVALSGFNPFPWPVTVKYRGMTILRQKDKTSIIFPDGQTTEIADESPQIISLEVV